MVANGETTVEAATAEEAEKLVENLPLSQLGADSADGEVEIVSSYEAGEPTYFCVDVSGSMSTDALRKAFDHIHMNAESGDQIFFFDTEPYGPWSVEDVLGQVYGMRMRLGGTRMQLEPVIDMDSVVWARCTKGKGRGGTDVEPLLKLLADKYPGKSVCISDGLFAQPSKFDSFVEIR
jgi:predicted metal-dependent peptidase